MVRLFGMVATALWTLTQAILSPDPTWCSASTKDKPNDFVSVALGATQVARHRQGASAVLIDNHARVASPCNNNGHRRSDRQWRGALCRPFRATAHASGGGCDHGERYVGHRWGREASSSEKPRLRSAGRSARRGRFSGCFRERVSGGRAPRRRWRRRAVRAGTAEKARLAACRS